MVASAKFLIPFSLLVGIGTHVTWPHTRAASRTAVYVAMEQASLPFAEPIVMQPPTTLTPEIKSVEPAIHPTERASLVHLLPGVLAATWLIGFMVVLVRWRIRWRRVSAAVREGELMRTGREVEILRRLEQIEIGGIRRPIEMVVTRGSIEPGIFGFVQPILMWPHGISERLDDAHVEAVLAHEVWHVRRGDNLAATMHMVVEAIFWFYPMVWWLGRRLAEERERACDEEVVQLYPRREVYAESILKVCEFCVESPLACVSGVTGADLKKRIVHIMTKQVGRNLNLTRKLLLATVGSIAIAVPVIAGALDSPLSLSQVPRPKEAVAAVIKVAMSVKAVAPMIAAAVEPGAAPQGNLTPQTTPLPAEAGDASSTTNAMQSPSLHHSVRREKALIHSGC
jgi:beta-lactamase regulating signal transducer with metallopeptidase domain